MNFAILFHLLENIKDNNNIDRFIITKDRSLEQGKKKEKVDVYVANYVFTSRRRGFLWAQTISGATDFLFTAIIIY